MRDSLSSMLRIQLPIWLVAPMLALMLVIGLGAGYVGGTWLNRSTSCPEAPEICTSFENFWKSWNLARDEYVDPQAAVPQKMIDGAIEGMLDSLGDNGHTRYLPPEQARAEREELSGKFEGIGAYIDVKDGQALIVQPMEGSPAEQAGLRANDIILKVDGQEMRGVDVAELRSKVRGPKGTTVTLTVQHVGEVAPVDITITRAEIETPSVTWRMLPNHIAMIHLNQFAERAGDEIKQALTDARAQGATALVLDLRNNPGGYVNELVSVASQFLPADTAVLLEQDRSGKQVPYKTSAGGVATDLPLVVLVNTNSASSAEILAGALKDAGRARLVGEPTFGTATVLRTFNLNDGAQVRIGTTQWLTPKGQVVRGQGIQPDELVSLAPNAAPLTPANAARLDAQALLASDDVQLVRALEVLKALATH
ncbi:MAG: S41 family peptidase [Kouleothrix sp.]|jgi:carboxyl-terminal processing protease|nr:S41 family peptidase [Kouleothrix sp.]